jgi:diguanylate cyclase (GGDEF)-like protein
VRPADFHAPSALLMWCKRGSESGSLDRKVVERMTVVYEELCKVAQRMIDHCAVGAPPTLELYDAFENQFEGFVTQIRRLHQDIADAGMAVDAVTGLRTVSGMRADLKREQDRFDRKGTSFSIANIEVDKLPELQQTHDRRALESIYATVAQVIARTIRSFDDAYFLGKGEYLVILKHVEFMDACTVMDRLRAEIDSTPIFLPGGDKVKISASFGIAEALQRESADTALQNAKTALQQAKASGGNRVAEYRETSALEQYAKDVSKGA